MICSAVRILKTLTIPRENTRGIVPFLKMGSALAVLRTDRMCSYLQIAVWNYAQGVLLHVVQMQDLGAQAHVHEITGVAPWRAPGHVNARVMPPEQQPAPKLHVVVSVDSTRPRAPGRSSRGGSEGWSLQAPHPGMQGSQQRGTQRHAPQHLDIEAVGSVAPPPPPACVVLQINCDTGAANACRHLLLFDAARGQGNKDGGPEPDCSPVPVRSCSMACDNKHVAAGFQSGTVAIWSGGSARLVALLRDPRGSNNALRDQGSQASRTSSTSRSCKSQQTGVGKQRRNSAVTCLVMHPSLPLVAAGRSDGILDVWAL
jgi:hypothetical protein